MLPITEIDDIGVGLRAKVNYKSNEPVVDHGFFIKEATLNPNFSFVYKSAAKVSLGKDVQANEFYARVESGLTKNVQYHVAAYVEHPNNKLVLTLGVPFTAKGSKLPVILAMAPATGIEGDTITISGENLAKQAKVFLYDGNYNGPEAQIISSTPSDIQVIIPAYQYRTNTLRPSLLHAGETIIAPEAVSFRLLDPKPEKIVPEFVPGDQEFTITGQNFSKFPQLVEVLFNGRPCVVKQVTATSIVAKSPAIVTSVNEVIVKVGNRESSVYKVSGVTPYITDFKPKTLCVGDTFSFKLDNYNINNSTYFSSITFRDEQNNYFTIPQEKIIIENGRIHAVFTNFTDLAPVTVERVVELNFYDNQGNGGIASSAEKIALRPFWNKVADIPANISLDPFILHDLNFVIDNIWYLGSTESGKLYSYNPAANRWTNLSQMEPVLVNIGACTDGKSIFLTGNFSANETEIVRQIWQYTPGDDRWLKHSEYKIANSPLFSFHLVRPVPFWHNGSLYDAFSLMVDEALYLYKFDDPSKTWLEAGRLGGPGYPYFVPHFFTRVSDKDLFYGYDARNSRKYVLEWNELNQWKFNTSIDTFFREKPVCQIDNRLYFWAGSFDLLEHDIPTRTFRITNVVFPSGNSEAITTFIDGNAYAILDKKLLKLQKNIEYK